jgi:hypothetical protein
MSSICGRSPVDSGVREELVALLRDHEAMVHLYDGARKGGHGLDDARDLVHGVINDIYIGNLACDLTALTLSEHVLECARRERWRRTRERATFAPLWELSEDDTPAVDPPNVAVAFELRADPADVPALLARVRRDGADDRDLLLVLDAYERGTLRKAQVLRATGLSAARYHNAQRRLRRLAVAAVASLDSGPVVDMAQAGTAAAAPTEGPRAALRAALGLRWPRAGAPALRRAASAAEP